jgi:hypothetical protein
VLRGGCVCSTAGLVPACQESSGHWRFGSCWMKCAAAWVTAAGRADYKPVICEVARFLLHYDRPTSISIRSGRKDDLHEFAFRVSLRFSRCGLGCNGPASPGARVVRVVPTRGLRLGASTRPWSRERDSHAPEGMRASHEEGREGQGEAASRPRQGAQESVVLSPEPELGARLTYTSTPRTRQRSRVDFHMLVRAAHRLGALPA